MLVRKYVFLSKYKYAQSQQKVYVRMYLGSLTTFPHRQNVS